MKTIGLLGALAGVMLSASLANAQPPSNQELMRQIDQLKRQLKRLEAEVHSSEHREPAVMVPPSPPLQPEVPPQGPLVTVPPATPPVTEAENKENAFVARALENTLVDQGGLLLSPWTMQIVPDFSFAYQSTYTLSFVANSIFIPGANGTSILTQRSHESLLEWGLGFRIGLPWGMQANVRVPFGWDSAEATFGGARTTTSSAGGLGDISFSLQKQVLTEKNWMPGAIVNVFYKAATGNTNLTRTNFATFPYTVGTGSGFPAVGAGITFVKRQDPLVFLGSLTYQHNFDARIGGFDQAIGDDYGFRIASVLAASPDTSLRVAWETTWQQKGTFNHIVVPGSDQVFSWLELGVGSVLTPNLFLDASIAAGLTKDTPDFRFQISFPYRF